MIERVDSVVGVFGEWVATHIKYDEFIKMLDIEYFPTSRYPIVG